MTHYRWQNDLLVLHCHVQPGAKRNEIVGIHGERLKVRLNAPPVDGKANAQLVKHLAREFAVNKADVKITRGFGSRQKTVSIRGPGAIPPACEIACTPE